MPDQVETEVVVVGAGPVGLTIAGLLGRQNVRTLVIERRDRTLSAPAAHVLRNGARQVLALLGVEQAIEAAAPEMSLDYVVWCATLGGAELGRLDLRGQGTTESGRVPLRPWTNLSQNRLEPILADAVATMDAVEIRRGTQCVEVSQSDDRAMVTTRDSNGVERVIRADWVIAADGAGSGVRKSLGIDMVGDGPLGRFAMVHFAADLSRWIEGRPSPIFWISHPEATGTLIVHDLATSHVFMTPLNGDDGELESIPDRLTTALGIDVDLEIVSIDSWVPYSQVASRYRDGRVLLIGDAAHRFPPSGGLGMNTGILEAHNLAWKLAMVQSGTANIGLIDSYDEECRPAAEKNAAESLLNAIRLSLVDSVVGPAQSLVELEARLSSLSIDEGNRLTEAIELQRSHFAWDGVAPMDGGDDGPRTVRADAPYGRFTLRAPAGEPWAAAAASIEAELGVTIEIDERPLGPSAGQPDQATPMLIRPDGVVVWSSDRNDAPSSRDDVAATVRARLLGVLDRAADTERTVDRLPNSKRTATPR